MIIAEKKMVKASYDLYVDGEEGKEEELMERATEQSPLAFCYGVGMMLPMFEANLAGKKAGETFDFRIDCNDAYGEYDDAGLIDLDKQIFMIDGKFDNEMIFAGNVVPLQDTEGNRINAQVVEVKENTVQVDLNHPLAGENLHFVGKVLEVRDATEEELNQLMGGGCSCGSCNCSGDCGEGGCGGCH